MNRKSILQFFNALIVHYKKFFPLVFLFVKELARLIGKNISNKALFKGKGYQAAREKNVCKHSKRYTPYESPTLRFLLTRDCAESPAPVPKTVPEKLSASFKWTSQVAIGPAASHPNYYTESHQGDFGEFWDIEEHIIKPTALGHIQNQISLWSSVQL